MTTPDSASKTSLIEEPGDLPMFSQPRKMPKDDPLTTSTTTSSTTTTTGANNLSATASSGTSTTESLSDEDVDADGWADSPIDETTPLGSSTPSSSPASIARHGATAATLQPPIEAVCRMTGLGLHLKLAPGDNGLWLMDDDDLEMIAGPLASIAARHAPISAGNASDLSDGIELAVGVTGYTLKNMQRQKAEYSAATLETEQ
jgi:hypothetical protein